MRSADWIAIATIITAHGINGDVRCQALSDQPERYAVGVSVRIATQTVTRTIERVRWQQDRLILKFSGLDSRNEALAVAKLDVLVAVADRQPLPSEHYYVDDLRGLHVITKQGYKVGTVHDVLPNPANDLLHVQTVEGGWCLIPIVRAFVTVDLPSHRVIVDPIPGLLSTEDHDAN